MRPDYRLATISVLAIATLALAGCGESGTVEAENESAEAVAAKVAKADLKPSAGRWETQMKIVSMDMPGMPPEMQGMMKDQLGKVETSVSCLTKEEAAKSEKEFFKPSQSSDCIYNSFTMGGGKIAADMTCNDKNSTQNMQMSGTYGAEAYAMKVKADGNMGPQEMSMEMEIASKRVGECDGKEES